MNTPFLILIDGPMGSGKTTISKLLSQKIPDAARIALPDIKRLIPNHNEKEETLLVIREVIKAMVNTYLENGVSVIMEQITTASGAEGLRKITESHGARFYAYRLTAPKELRLQRVHDRTKEMVGTSDLLQSKIEELDGYFEPNDAFYLNNPIDSAVLIDTQDLGLERVVETIISKLS